MKMKSSSGGTRQRSFGKVSASSVLREAKEEARLIRIQSEQWAAEPGTTFPFMDKTCPVPFSTFCLMVISLCVS